MLTPPPPGHVIKTSSSTAKRKQNSNGTHDTAAKRNGGAVHRYPANIQPRQYPTWHWLPARWERQAQGVAIQVCVEKPF